ncbi:MAG: methyltransferase domain-containing protein [Actinomycetota bacterium]|nr:methyltransferase domain-containing protein [Actinomycetota bacterium]
MSTPSRRALLRAAEVLNLDSEDLQVERGYLDLVGGEEPRATGVAQRLMSSRVVPNIYERWWRPALGRVLKGPTGPSMAQEERLARDLLALRGGATVLDVACGPGNFTRSFAADVGESGTVIGIDLSAPMLARALDETDARQVVYVRADAVELMIRAESVDAVCCFAALHLFSDPWAALDRMASALVPGGRLAVLTTSRPEGLPGAMRDLLGRVSGMRMIRGDQLTRELLERGLEVVHHHVFGLMQIVSARRSPNPPQVGA